MGKDGCVLVGHIPFSLICSLTWADDRSVAQSMYTFRCWTARLVFAPFNQAFSHTDSCMHLYAAFSYFIRIKWYFFIFQEQHKKLHPRLPVTVAETLLHSDPQIELPLWLVHMFKVRNATITLIQTSAVALCRNT